MAAEVKKLPDVEIIEKLFVAATFTLPKEVGEVKQLPITNHTGIRKNISILPRWKCKSDYYSQGRGEFTFDQLNIDYPVASLTIDVKRWEMSIEPRSDMKWRDLDLRLKEEVKKISSTPDRSYFSTSSPVMSCLVISGQDSCLVAWKILIPSNLTEGKCDKSRIADGKDKIADAKDIIPGGGNKIFDGKSGDDDKVDANNKVGGGGDNKVGGDGKISGDNKVGGDGKISGDNKVGGDDKIGGESKGKLENDKGGDVDKKIKVENGESKITDEKVNTSSITLANEETRKIAGLVYTLLNSWKEIVESKIWPSTLFKFQTRPARFAIVHPTSGGGYGGGYNCREWILDCRTDIKSTSYPISCVNVRISLMVGIKIISKDSSGNYVASDEPRIAHPRELAHPSVEIAANNESCLAYPFFSWMRGRFLLDRYDDKIVGAGKCLEFWKMMIATGEFTDPDSRSTAKFIQELFENRL